VFQIYQMTVIDATARGLKHPKFWGVFTMSGNNSSGLLMYLIGRRKYPIVNMSESNSKELEKRKKGAKKLNPILENCTDEDLVKQIQNGHNYIFVGKVGRFCPIKPGCNGGILYRENEGKYFAVTGTKGYRWLESELVQELGRENDIDNSYYENLANEAVESIAEYGDYEWFVSEEPYTEEPKNPLLDEIIDIASDVLPF
jgi:hypothetical protein